jgi:hypothetical protein
MAENPQAALGVHAYSGHDDRFGNHVGAASSRDGAHRDLSPAHIAAGSRSYSPSHFRGVFSRAAETMINARIRAWFPVWLVLARFVYTEESPAKAPRSILNVIPACF